METPVRSLRRLPTALGTVLALAACSGQPAEPGALTIDPPGPVSVGVGESVPFDAGPAPDGVVWSLEGGPGVDPGAIAPDGT